MKFRILKTIGSREYYWPQYKSFFGIWRYFKEPYKSPFGTYNYDTWVIIVKRKTQEIAKNFIENYYRKLKEKKIKSKKQIIQYFELK